MLSTIILYFFFATIAVQIVYLFLTLIGLYRKSGDAKELKPVSVVIAARNEIENLQKHLPALITQDYDQYEVIIVDDQSDDGTEEWLQKEKKNHKHLQYIRINNTPGHIHSKKYALTIGIKNAKNPVILLTDGDCYPASDQWIRQMAAKFSEKKKIVLGYSGYKSAKSFLNYFIQFETLLTGLQYLGLAGLGVPYMGVGRNLSYQKNSFMKRKGIRNFSL